MEDQRSAVPGASPKVRVFGDFAVLHGDHVSSVAPRMLRSLLGVLVVEANRVVSADRLVDHLWHDDPPTAPGAGVQAYVSNLRKLLEPHRLARTTPAVLLTKDPGYSLRLDPMNIDVSAFEALATSGREAIARAEFTEADAVLGEAAALWTGPPFAELADEPWAQSAVVRLGELHAAAVEDRMVAWLELGRHEAAIDVLRSATEAEPSRERGWELLLVALYRSQRQADALRTFQDCRKRFRDELGLDPGPQLRSLEQQILEHAAALDPPVTQRPRPLPSADASSVRVLASDAEAFIGRRVQLARLRERIGHLHDGGGLVALVGEAGIGKSTFADRVAADGRASGIAVVQTRCLDAAPPLWPWIQLIQALPGTATDAARRHAEQTLRGDRHSLVDERSAMFGAYEAVRDALREAAAVSPLMLLIDDVHIADPATWTLLTYLTEELTSMAVLLVVAARDDEGDSGVRERLAGLLSRRGTERLAMRGLDPEDVGMFTRRFPDAEQSDDLTAAFHERTAGNPYFLTQLARLLSSTAVGGRFTAADVRAAAIPDDLRGVLNRRIARLPTDTRSVLAVAAVVGREADLVVVGQAAGSNSEDLMLALEPAIAAGLLVEVEHRWACRFVHPLVHEVITSGMTRLHKARLHARVAKALLDRDPHRSDVAEIAHHLLEAGPVGQPEQAIEHARNAARRSARQGIWSESVRLLSSALELADTVSASPGTRCDLLIELGEALRWSGDAAGSHAILESAISGAYDLGDRHRLAMAAVAFGAIRTWGARDYGRTDPRVVAILEQLLAEADPEDTLHIRLSCALGIELHYTDRAEDGMNHIARGVAVARAIGDNELLGTALVSQCFVTRSPDHLADHRHAAEDALALAGRGISDADELTARIHLLSEHLRRGDFGAFEADLARCRDAASRLHSGELDGHLAFSEAGLALLEARWDDADRLCRLAEEAIRITSSPGAEWSHLAGLVATRRARGLLHEVAADLATTRTRTGFDAFRPFDVLAVLGSDSPEQARALVWRAPSSIRRDWTWFFAIGGWAEVAATLGVPDPAKIYDELLPFANDIAIAGSGLDSGGPVHGLLACLAERVGRPDDARRHARASLQREQQLGIRAWEPRSRAVLERLG